ncbi:hypothetical protein [Streptomyces dysideae]|nr:hypothetical protein [Streptomyces dysideae]
MDEQEQGAVHAPTVRRRTRLSAHGVEAVTCPMARVCVAERHPQVE